MFSVLLPTRERAELCKQSIESLGEGDFEVLLYVDKDDPQLDNYRKLASRQVRLFIRPRLTYYKFNEMVNLLCKEAKGDWLLLWNDDMRILSSWIDKIQYNSKTPLVLNFWNPDNMQDNLAPIISRKMYEIMGHFSLSAHCDSWVQDIANTLGVHVPVRDIKVEHLRESLSDATKEHSQGAYSVTSPGHDSDEMKLLRQHDIVRLINYV